MDTVNVTLVGVGGQGIILAADILAKTAAISGLDVKKSEIHGMAQRGGSVSSQVRFGDKVHSPVIQAGKTDILVAFDKLEAVRNSGLLAPGGKAVVNNAYLVPVTVSSGQQADVADLDSRVAAIPGLVLVDAAEIAGRDVGNIRTANMVMAGALSSFCPFGEQAWLAAMEELLSGPKAKLLEINKKAFAIGREAAAKAGKA